MNGDFALFLFVGGTVGALIMMFIFIISNDIGTTEQDIEKIRQAEKDCTVKEYYYIDKHRTFCDLIGVSP